MLDLDALLTEKDAAAKLGYSLFWLRDLRKRGAGPRYIKLGNRAMYDPADLSAWLESLKQN